MIKYREFYALFLLLMVAVNLHGVDDLGERLESKGKDLFSDIASYGAHYLEDFMKEREKTAPFTAGIEPGVCMYRKRTSYRFPDCQGKIGVDLRACCLAKTKDDMNLRKEFDQMGTPSWMEDNEAFDHTHNFFGEKQK